MQAWVNVCIFWLQKKGTVLIFIYKLGKWRARHAVTGKAHTALRGRVGWLIHGHTRVLASWGTSTTTHFCNLSCKASEKGFVNHFCCLPAQSPWPPHYSLRLPAPCRVRYDPNWQFLARSACEYAHNIKQEEGFQFICAHLGLFVAWKKKLAGFPPLCNSLGRLLSPGDSHADVWVKRAAARIHGVFSMVLINSVMLLVLRRERWTETVLRTTDSFFPKAKKCHFHELFLYAKAQNGFPKVCIWFYAAFTSLLNLFCTQIQLPW